MNKKTFIIIITRVALGVSLTANLIWWQANRTQQKTLEVLQFTMHSAIHMIRSLSCPEGTNPTVTADWDD